MYRLGVIEESVDDRDILQVLSPHFVSQRIENVPEDECPVWHVNEYHITEDEIKNVVNLLQQYMKETWYCHAFSDKSMFVVLAGKWFEVSLKRDETWDEMMEYGTAIAKIERSYLETIPLHI